MRGYCHHEWLPILPLVILAAGALADLLVGIIPRRNGGKRK